MYVCFECERARGCVCVCTYGEVRRFLARSVTIFDCGASMQCNDEPCSLSQESVASRRSCVQSVRASCQRSARWITYNILRIMDTNDAFALTIDKCNWVVVFVKNMLLLLFVLLILKIRFYFWRNKLEKR